MGKNQPSVLISVIVPIYNTEEYLERCLKSIINQTFTNIEIICVDDGSTDKSREILHRFTETDKRIIAIHKENGGVSSARNVALTAVRGQYVFFVDSDDWIERDTLEKLVSCMTEDVDVVFAGVCYDAVQGQKEDRDRIQSLQKYYDAKLSGEGYVSDDINIIKNITTVAWGKLFKYEIIKNNGIKFIDLHIAEDVCFMIEYFVFCKKYCFVKQNFYHYVVRTGSLITSGFNREDILYAFDYLYKRLDSIGLLLKYRNLITYRYSEALKSVFSGILPSKIDAIKERASELAQYYDISVFNSDVVWHVKNREFHMIPLFDKDVLIILKVAYHTIEDAFRTIQSLLVQTYKLPKIILIIKAGNFNHITKEDILQSLPKELELHVNTELFIELAKNFSLASKVKEFQNYVVATVESGVVYPPKWLRCVMAAYIENRDAFATVNFENMEVLEEAVLFKDFAILDINSTGSVTVFKSKFLLNWIYAEQEKNKFEKYNVLRVDIRNKGGEGSNVLAQSVTPEQVSLRRPDWLKNGISVESEADKMQLVLECQGDGELEVGLMGRDVRNADGTRYPVWIDCTSFAVNGEAVFEETKTVCHDKRYVYRRKVADGEVVTLEMRWSECQSPSVLYEYRQLQRDLKRANAEVSKTEAALRNANQQMSQVKRHYAKYSTLRVDIRNKGSEGSNVLEQSVIPETVSLRRPEWLKDGITVESEAETMQLVLACQGDGELEVDLMGRDVRNAEGTRYPVWIDCTYFAVNGEAVFEETKTVCHDKRYVYRRKVADGEVVTLEMRWSECQSPSVLYEYRQLQRDLKRANAEVSKTEAALKKVNEKASATETALKNAKAKNVKSNQEKQNIAKKLEKEKQKNAELERELNNIKNGWSFRVGRVITWLPRRIKK